MSFFEKIFGTKEERNEMKRYRIDRRNDRKMGRWGFRTDRSYFRSQSNIEAYRAGIDPRASMWGGLSSITGSLSSAALGMYGMHVAPDSAADIAKSINPNATNQRPFSGDNSMIVLLVLGLLFLFGGKKRR